MLCSQEQTQDAMKCKIQDLKAWSVLFFLLLLSWIQVLKKKTHLALGNHLFLCALGLNWGLLGKGENEVIATPQERFSDFCSKSGSGEG